MDAVKLNQDEHEHISSALEVERVEDNLFRSRSLWLPKHSRGVFGGYVLCTEYLPKDTPVTFLSFNQTSH